MYEMKISSRLRNLSALENIGTEQDNKMFYSVTAETQE